MKYRLKKDLPFAKAGREIEIRGREDGNSINIDIDIDSLEITLYISKNNLDKVISWGWIEEVKPREWYALIENGKIRAIFEEKRHCWVGDLDKVIKVREVLE